MFSLIITVISIALVAALAVASVYYGGPALSKGTAKASAATIVSQGQQISGAATLFSSDKGGASVVNLEGTDATDPTTDGLVISGYLTSVPAVPAAIGGDWTLDSANDLLTVTSTADITDICLAIEQNRDSSVSDVPTASNEGQFGCFGTAGATPGEVVQPFTIYYSL